MKNYTYSISIPHFNSPTLLKRMLESIPEREDIQVIVVDDGSSKYNQDKLQKLRHKNLELIINSKNQGGGIARNIGLSRALGKWFISVDSDDYFSKDAFEIFDQYKDANLNFIEFGVKCVDTITGEVTRELNSNNSVKAYLKKPNKKNTNLLKFANTESWNKLVSMAFIKKYNIHYENCRINIDVYYSFLIAIHAHNFKVIPDQLYYFTENSNSITHQQRSIEREFQFYLAVQKRNGFYKKMGLGHWPFYRPDFLYIPHMIKKHGIKEACLFFIYWAKHLDERNKARKKYDTILK